MRPFILFAAIALFSQMGGRGTSQLCPTIEPSESELTITSSGTFMVTVLYPYAFPCNLTVEKVHATDGKVYGSTKCSMLACKKFEMDSPVCTAEYVLKPQCTGWKPNCTRKPTTSDPFTLNSFEKKTCPSDLIFACSGNVCKEDQISNDTVPGCYCKNKNAYLYQKDNKCYTDSQCPPPIPGTRISVNLFVQPCVEAQKTMAITLEPKSNQIVRLIEVRDSSGDLFDNRNATNATNGDEWRFDAPPVGIYEVTVFGEDLGRNFNESAMFITKQDNAPHQFRVTALPIDGGVTACFSSAQKDVSYLCQQDSGTKMPCSDCKSYSRENGIGTITIYTESGVKVESFQYRV